MINETKKLLTSYLGECWHADTPTEGGRCPICDKGLTIPMGAGRILMPWNRRTFTVPDDMHALGRRLVEKGDDFAFESYLYLKFHQDLTFKKVDRGTSFIAYFIDPARFCSLVGKWLEHKEADEYTKFKTQSELVKKGEGASNGIVIK